jgi:hypothetical protein
MKKSSLFILVITIILSSCTQFQPEKLERTPGQEGSRQIHLDFHTSEAIDNIGADFNKEQFQAALIAGNVNSINIFGKGHHSWSYYPTKAGSMHPGLDFDLLKAQIEACHEIGVTAQVYFTIGWSANDALSHPEWTILDKNGTSSYKETIKNLGPEDPFGWGWDLLSPEGEYLELILAQTEELVTEYDLDGVWYDIIPLSALNYNQASKKDMKERGIDLNDENAVRARHVEKMNEFLEKTHNLIKEHKT